MHLALGRLVQVDHERPGDLAERAWQRDARADLEEPYAEDEATVGGALEEALVDELPDEPVHAPLRQAGAGRELADAERGVGPFEGTEDGRDPPDDGDRWVVRLSGTHSLIMPDTRAHSAASNRRSGRR